MSGSAPMSGSAMANAADTHGQSAGQAGGADDPALLTRKRKIVKAQTPADVEKLLTQLGYNPAALKKARPGSEPQDSPGAKPNAE